MVGLMMAGIALTLGRRHVGGTALIAVAVAVKATGGARTAVHGVGLDAPPAAIGSGRSSSPRRVRWLSGCRLRGAVRTRRRGTGLADRACGFGQDHQLADSADAIANLANAIGGLFMTPNFYAILEVTRLAGIGIIVVTLPLLWWRFPARRPRGARRHRVGDAGCLSCSCPPPCPGTTPGHWR